MKKTIIFLLIVIAAVQAYSQEKELSQALGFFGGMISGSGFSYRQMQDNWGWQINFGVLSFKNDDEFSEGYSYTVYDGSWMPDPNMISTEYRSGRETWANVGITLFKPLHRSGKSLFYVMAGVSNYYSDQEEYEQDYKYSPVDEDTYHYGPHGEKRVTNDKENTFHVGAGLGFEYRLTDNIRLSLEWPLSYGSDGNINMYIPQGGVHYYFK
ncbi:MAG TPA: outer membrane beta-barrel protein [bacterium]|nr:outer membrane beta-barrel protein [bacterium]HPN42322.1 outer membrane beta-barrel protein [bacterium]